MPIPNFLEMNNEPRNQTARTARRLVEREVYYNVSMLISTLVRVAGSCDTKGELDYDDLINLCQRDDWETPVTEFIQGAADLADLEAAADMAGDWEDVLEAARGKLPHLLKQYSVKYSEIDEDSDGTEEDLEFECWAENDGHAAEQCLNAYPGVALTYTEDMEYDLDDEIAANPDLEGAIREAVLNVITKPEEYEEIGRWFNLDPETAEVYEHYIVSEHAAQWLEAAGEVVGEVCGLPVWGRTCTGQAVALDYVWQQKAAETWPEELETWRN